MTIKEILRQTYRLSPFGLLRRMTALEARVNRLERSLRSRRISAIDELAEYLVNAQVPGDYAEFGVFSGSTFIHACNVMMPVIPSMRFVAFDSFCGLPEPQGVDALDGHTSNFHRGEFSCSKQEFLRNVAAAGVELRRVIAVEGWFQDTLTPATAAYHNIGKIAFAWIDGDLYESTVPVLNFLTSRLTVGGVIVFDDWSAFRNLPHRGEQRALREWQERNPHIRLNELMQIGANGKAFSVETC